MTTQLSTRSTVIPGMWYRDVEAAIDWLVRVFGFERHAIARAPEGALVHAELTLGGGMLMVGPVRTDAPSRFIKQPDQLGGAETHGLNLIVPDADVVYARAKAAGASIVFDIEDKPYGGRGFTCLDLEGRLWNVTTYDPWKPKTS